jgi:hypothetical protein
MDTHGSIAYKTVIGITIPRRRRVPVQGEDMKNNRAATPRRE